MEQKQKIVARSCYRDLCSHQHVHSCTFIFIFVCLNLNLQRAFNRAFVDILKV